MLAEWADTGVILGVVVINGLIGFVSVICSDKTGTLTRNEMTVSRVRPSHPREDTIPFESERRFMATLHHDHEGNRFIFATGAPERILPMSASAATADGPAALNREHWLAWAEALATDGLRVLALASGRPSPDRSGELTIDEVDGSLVLLGLVGLTYLPAMNALFGTAPLELRDWGVVLVVAATVVPLVELEKYFLRRRARRG